MLKMNMLLRWYKWIIQLVMKNIIKKKRKEK